MKRLTIEDAYGPAYLRLPWKSAVEAHHRLPAERRRAVALARRDIAQAWLRDAPYATVLDALATGTRSSDLMLIGGTRGSDEEWWASRHNGLCRPDAIDDSLRQRSQQRRGFNRSLEQPGLGRPFAPAASALSNVWDPEPDLDNVAERFHHVSSGRFQTQLRSVVTVQRQVAGCLVDVRERRTDRFSLEDHAVAAALLPAVAHWLHAASALGLEPSSPRQGLSAAALDAFATPAVVLRRGRVVFANRAARHLASAGGRDRLLRAVRHPATECSPISCGDLGDLTLALLPSVPSSPKADPLDALSPSQREIARLMARGLADKEIAVALDRPLATVRTYAGRVLKRLGVSSRRELMVLAGR